MTTITDREHLRRHIAMKLGLEPQDFEEDAVISTIQKCGRRLDAGRVFHTCLMQGLIRPSEGFVINDFDDLTVGQLLDFAD